MITTHHARPPLLTTPEAPGGATASAPSSGQSRVQLEEEQVDLTDALVQAPIVGVEQIHPDQQALAARPMRSSNKIVSLFSNLKYFSFKDFYQE